MKKLILAVLLLAILIGVSYYKELRHKEQSHELYNAAKKEVSQKLALARQQLDSLQLVLSDTVHAVTESLQVNEAHYLAQVDSLSYLIDSLNNKLAALDEKYKSLAEKGSGQKRASSTLTHESALAEKVLVYYKKKYKSLPTDLSEYEKRVALAEIREETAQHFKISLTELNKIRKRYKLSY